MNKQELIKAVIELPVDCSGSRPKIDQLTTLELIKLLNEPEKIQIPQFVADWIEYCKFTHVNLQHALIVGDVYFYNYANQKDFSKLKEFLEIENNQDLFARAWLDGYEVEKEKRYEVKIKASGQHLARTKLKEVAFMYNGACSHFTRKELEESGLGWVFSCEGVEVEEVEE